MRNLILLVLAIGVYQLAHTQGAHFHRYKTTYRRTDNFSFTENDPTKRIYISLNVGPNKIVLRVNKKGDDVMNKEYTLSDPEYDRFLQTIQACEIKKKPAKKSDACVGGVSQLFSIRARIRKGNFKLNKNISGTRIKCKAYDYSSLQGDLDKLAEAFKLLVPGYDAMIDSIKTTR
jgi:hypothetical protein